MNASGSNPGPSPRDVLPATSRYALLLKIAAGGMATVYVGRLSAAAGTGRLFAIKRAHAHLADEPSYRRLFVAEARLASRLHHPNVVAVQDVEELEDELLLVMDYVEGTSLVELSPLDDDARTRTRLAIRIVLDACAGLQAAHDLTDEAGKPLNVVHRDVTPHNVLIGVDGIARVTDFGVAKSMANTGPATVTGGLKGKLAYMAPEYVEKGVTDRRGDLFALAVILWETLTKERLFQERNEGFTLANVMRCEVKAPSAIARDLDAALDAVVLRALDRAPEKRFATVAEFGDELERVARARELVASHSEVGAMVRRRIGSMLDARRTKIASAIAGGADETRPLTDSERTLTRDPNVATLSAQPGNRSATERAASTERHDVAIRTSTVSDGSQIVAREGPTPARARRGAIILGSVLVVGSVGWLVARGSLIKSNPPRPAAAQNASVPSVALSAPSVDVPRQDVPAVATAASAESSAGSPSIARAPSASTSASSHVAPPARLPSAPPRQNAAGSTRTQRAAPSASERVEQDEPPPNPYDAGKK